MRQSVLFPKTVKEDPKDAQSANHKFLVRGGFIDQLMSGSWSILPLGQRVIGKINQIIREEMNAIGGQELSLPLLHPKEIWNETERWDAAREVMYQLSDARGREYALSFTHEEIVMDLIRKKISSYKDLPLYVYQFSTKFRNEPRATGGILRGREFLMKDLYSAHVSEADLMAYYETVKEAYLKIFNRLGLKVLVTEAAGGVFTKAHTHEFQVLSPVGEDTVFYCENKNCGFSQNKEVAVVAAGGRCPTCQSSLIKEGRAIEVGNIFPLGTMYSEKMQAFFTDKNGARKPIWFGSYGIGPTRVMGTIVEEYHDEKGIIWPEAVSPFNIHLLGIKNQESRIMEKTEELYEKLTKAREEVLWDDREDVSAGQKFADSDLIGIPWRVVISEKSLAGGGVEVKKRNQAESKIVSQDQLLNFLLR
ncbi:MAG: His/Gly/Thr/Pro-type tRNA ligase C-terminal domain-containing protein [Patescibacteria group bacterium]|nr:His/Gly/Thr/Pro-type tRNA ligase C-terminal domain-containing protein [Patescibacteria group bacterium]